MRMSDSNLLKSIYDTENRRDCVRLIDLVDNIDEEEKEKSIPLYLNSDFTEFSDEWWDVQRLITGDELRSMISKEPIDKLRDVARKIFVWSEITDIACSNKHTYLPDDSYRLATAEAVRAAYQTALEDCSGFFDGFSVYLMSSAVSIHGQTSSTVPPPLPSRYAD
jgi:hypothetical protein